MRNYNALPLIVDTVEIGAFLCRRVPNTAYSNNTKRYYLTSWQGDSGVKYGPEDGLS